MDMSSPTTTSNAEDALPQTTKHSPEITVLQVLPSPYKKAKRNNNPVRPNSAKTNDVPSTKGNTLCSSPDNAKFNDVPSPMNSANVLGSSPKSAKLNNVLSPTNSSKVLGSSPKSAKLNNVLSPRNSAKVLGSSPDRAKFNNILSPTNGLKDVAAPKNKKLVTPSPKIRHSRSRMPSFAMSPFLSQIQSAPCYQLPRTPLLDAKCYELSPRKETAEETCNQEMKKEQSSVKRKRSSSEEGEITPKRSHSTPEITPSRERTPSREENNFPSQVTPIRERNSFTSDITPKNERNSFYGKLADILPVRCVADQTPYASPPCFQPRFRLPNYSLPDGGAPFIDTHCHLDFLLDRQGWEGSWKEWRERDGNFPQNYAGCLAIFCNPHSFAQISKWERFLKEDDVWASFGCHPHNAKSYNDRIEESLCLALQHPKVRAIGEIGLDYSNRNSCQREVQFDAFRRQLKIGLATGLPVVIHCREAHEDGMRIVNEVLPPTHPLHLHCFTDTWAWAERWITAFPNLFVGLTNVVTFPSARNAHQVAARIPLDRLLLETDTPYFVPRMVQGYRHSHPGMALHVAAQIAALRGTDVQTVLKHTRDNTRRLYNI